jgi:hypothetical protein
MNGSRLLAISLASSVMLSAESAYADEGGINFWLPGQYGSFAATPAEPGWAWASVYYHASLAAGGDRQFSRGGKIIAGLDANANLLLFGPAYTFAEPVAGGQLTLSMMAVGGRNEASIDAVLTGPNGNTLSGSASDALTAFGDLYPTATLKWNSGVHNYMTYVTGDIPVGAYERTV